MRFLRSALRPFFRQPRTPRHVALLQRSVDRATILAAKSLIAQNRARGPSQRLAEVEFSVFSQYGDDGIIQHLIHFIPGTPQTFVEFGVEDYTEANTRFLLVNDNWRGLVMDGDPANVARIKRQDYCWRHDLTPVAAFIDRDNINSLLADSGFAGETGILSIDIDGNDYWVWERITSIQPVVVIVEYNSVFGAARAVAVPYDPAFQRTAAHHSNLYWGCSLRALCVLAEQKGYRFVGSNSIGNNAYFVRADRLNGLPVLTAAEGHVVSTFRESRDIGGQLTFLSGSARLREIQDLPVVDVETGQSIPLQGLVMPD